MRVGGGADASSMNPFVIALVLLAVVAIWFLPRRFVVVPLLLTVFLTPFGQQLYLGGLHLFVGRILILSGLVRVFFAGRFSLSRMLPVEINGIDKCFFLGALLSGVGHNFSILERSGNCESRSISNRCRRGVFSDSRANSRRRRCGTHRENLRGDRRCP